jgi:PASTA domain
MRLFPRTPMIVMALAPLALAGAVAGPAAGTTAATACSAWNGAQPVNPGALSSLEGIAMVSPCDVWAVGRTSQGSGSPLRAVIEHWTGSSWATVPSPSDPAVLQSISAISASDIWAVGAGSDTNGALILHYDGTRWTETPTPPAGENGILWDVDGRTPTDAWAGGWTGDNPTRHPLMLHWDGTNWAPSGLPAAISGNGGEILAVSADSATDAWALANPPTGTGIITNELLHWDGSQWQLASITGPAGASIQSITALSPTDVWAAGFTKQTGGLQQTLTEHWDGTQWNVIPSPNPGAGQDNQLVDMTAASGSDVWAAGTYFTRSAQTPFALHWNGSSWVAVTLPVNGIQASDGRPESISAAANGQAWVSGFAGFRTMQPLSPFAVPVPAVPDVSGDTVSAATSALTAAGLTVSSTQNTTTNCAPSIVSKVASTDPAAGQQASFGQAVTLTVCSTIVINPTVTVPDVTGLTDSSARSAITSAGLTVGTITLNVDCTIPRGTVLSQDPDGGTSAPFGSAVNLTEATRSGRAVHQITPHFCTQ